METIKDRVRALCQRDGISVSELEKKLSIGNGTIGRWDNSKPRAEVLSKVASFFSVSSDYLLNGEQSEAEKIYRAEIQKTPTAFAIGENEVLLLETFRELSNAGKLRILAKLSEEYDKEKEQSKGKEDATLSDLRIG